MSGLSHLRTTTQLLRQTTTSFSSNPLTFLFLTFLLFSFHSLLNHSSLLLTSFFDTDPSLHSLLSRLPPHSPPSTRLNHHTRAPFLQLTRLGTLDDDFFSTDRSLFGAPTTPPLNATTVFLSGFKGISGISQRFSLRLEEGKETKKDDDCVNFDVKVFLKRDVAAIFFLVSLLSAVYGWVILGFTTVYSIVLAVMFVTVVNGLVGRVSVVWNGSRLGFKRVTGFVLMRWAVRDALSQLLGLWYFGEVEDQFSFFRLFVRLKLMPFTVVPPWIRGFEKEISGFLFAWFLLDTLIGLVLAVDGFVAIVDSRRRGREIVKEGIYLVSLLLHQAVQLKCLEAVLCGSFFRWVLVRVVGKSFASVIQSGLEVYFMTAWLVFYLAVRSKDAHSEGRRFGRREMESLIDGLR